MSAAYLDTHTAIVGASGAGKTVTAKVQAEALLDAGRHVCILDPTGAWWGMRSNAAGDGPGYDIPIFGGSHGDVQITAEQGGAVGSIIAGGVSGIVDISGLRTGAEQRLFARDLARALRKKPDGNFHFLIDEADEFAPQKPRDDYGFQVGEEITWMAKRGRLPGFVLTLITQRPASIDKEPLSQAQTLIVHQLVAPVDQKPIVDYLKEHADRSTLTMIKGSLAALEQGERWIYSPRLGILERGVSPMPKTFDSSRTPEPGEQAVEPKMLAQIDLGAIKETLAPTAKDISAEIGNQATGELSDESVKLRQQVADLIRANAECADVIAQQLDEIAELEAERDRWKKKAEHYDGCITAAIRALGYRDIEEIGRDLDDKRFNDGLKPARAPESAPEPVKAAPARLPARAAPSSVNRPSTITAGDPGLSKPLQKIVDAIAWWNAFGIQQPKAAQVAYIAGYASTSGTWDTYRSRLRTQGLIELSSGRISLTDAGVAAANAPDVKPTRAALHDAIRAKLAGPLVKFLDVLLQHYPNALSRADWASYAGYEPTSGTADTYRSRMMSLDLAESPERGFARAPDWMMP